MKLLLLTLTERGEKIPPTRFCLYSLTVRIFPCHGKDPGSIPIMKTVAMIQRQNGGLWIRLRGFESLWSSYRSVA